METNTDPTSPERRLASAAYFRKEARRLHVVADRLEDQGKPSSAAAKIHQARRLDALAAELEARATEA